VTSLSVLFDIFVKRIPNWLILFGLGGGLLLNALYGLSQFYNSLLGFVLGIAIFLIPFAMGWVGAGDVKYLGVVGSLLGFQSLPRVLFYSALAGGVLAISFVLYNRINLSISNFVADAWLDCKLAILSLGRMLPQDIGARASRGSHAVPLGVAIGAGTILAYYIDPKGTWAGF
jgi:Flp pilus assembly protein protease CpaA